ncbi:hypothetical protein INR49_023734 [Caranx melampygus]|nr:hypothetical protein INR49_023734 [Caranx melampygus]
MALRIWSKFILGNLGQFREVEGSSNGSTKEKKEAQGLMMINQRGGEELCSVQELDGAEGGSGESERQEERDRGRWLKGRRRGPGVLHPLSALYHLDLITQWSSSSRGPWPLFPSNTPDLDPDPDPDPEQRHPHEDQYVSEGESSQLETHSAPPDCRDAETITDVCNSTDLPEFEIISLLEEQLPVYRLRADTVYGYDQDDWLHTPLFTMVTAAGCRYMYSGLAQSRGGKKRTEMWEFCQHL